MQIGSFTKDNLKNVVRPAIQAALDKVGAEYGMKIALGNISFGQFEFKASVKTTIESSAAKEEAKNKEIREFNEYASYLGFKSSVLGCEFTSLMSGGRFRIVGVKMSSRKYPILAKRLEDGKVYKFSATFIKSILEEENKNIGGE